MDLESKDMKAKFLFLLLIFLGPLTAQAQFGDWNLGYGASAGFNDLQGFHYTISGQLSTPIDDHLSGGLGAYYSAGEQPSHDREFGVGPFLSYGFLLNEFLGASLRQEINYVNLYIPYHVSTNPIVYGHTEETGVASATSAGLTLFMGPLSVSGGYRLVVGLSNSRLDDGRSGPYFGLGLSF